MKLIELQDKITEAGLKIFSRDEVTRLLGSSRISVQKLLERYTQKGVLVRLKGGLYAFSSKLPSGYLIANKLCRPSYLSFETALSYYRLIPETVYGLTSATTKTTREFKVKDRVFTYHKIKKKAFTGYRLIEISGENVLFADKEKALADYLYYVFLRKSTWNDRLRVKGVDFKKLWSYLSLFENTKLLRWAKDVVRKAA